MPQSLHRTWAALAIATLAVLIVAILAGRDLVRDVSAPCPGKLHAQESSPTFSSLGPLEAVDMETVTADQPLLPMTSGPAFQLVFDKKKASGYGYPTQYSNVRVVWNEPGQDGTCSCGTMPIALSAEAPSDIHLFRVRGTSQYVVKGRTSYSHNDDNAVRAVFNLDPGVTHHIQADRILSMRHLPALVALFGLGALVVALFRSRRAMSYALRIHSWTEARLTPGGLIENENGGTLGTLEQTRMRAVPAGPVLVAPEAFSTTGLYRDVPIVARRDMAEGTHARWASGTTQRLRDARALAVISTACAMLAFGARLIA